MDLKQLILESSDLAEEVIIIPEWGNAQLLLRGLTCEQLDRARKGGTKQGQLDVFLFSVLLMIEAANDPESRKPLFEQAHRDALLKKNAKAVERIGERILAISGYTPTAADEAEKN